MVEVYEKDFFTDEVKRTVYQVLVMEVSTSLLKDHEPIETRVHELSEEICRRIKPLIKLATHKRNNGTELTLRIHLPYIQNMVVARAEEGARHAEYSSIRKQEKIDALVKELAYHRLPWYEKIWRSK